MTNKTPASRVNKTSYAHGRISSARSRERLSLLLWGSLTLLFLLAAETVWLDDVKLFGASFGSPGLGLCFAMALGYTVDREVGGAAGLIGGFLLDGALGESMMLRPLLYFLLGWFCGVLGGRLLAHNLPSFIVFSAVGAVADLCRAVVCVIFASGSLPPFSWVWHSQAPCVLLTVAGAVPVYGLTVWLVKKIVKT